MALVTTVFEVVGVLAAMALLLWFSTVLEARQLGPVGGVAGPEPVSHPEPEPAMVVALVESPVVAA